MTDSLEVAALMLRRYVAFWSKDKPEPVTPEYVARRLGEMWCGESGPEGFCQFKPEGIYVGGVKFTHAAVIQRAKAPQESLGL